MSFALSCFADDAALLGCWPLNSSLVNEASSQLKIIPYGASGRLTPASEWFEGGSLRMEGMALTTLPDLNTATGITITGWFSLNEIEMGFSKTAPETLVFLLNSSNPNEMFVFRILDGKFSAFSKTENKNLKTDFLIQEDEWTFFALVFNGNSVAIHQNGYTPTTIPLRNSEQYDRLYFGATSGAGDRALNGKMRDLRLFSGVLDAGAIKGIYESGLSAAGPAM